MTTTSPRFVPQLILPPGTTDISFYTNAFAAAELRRWNNDDGSLHVAELEIEGALFHLHEENPARGIISPADSRQVTAIIGLMVADVDTCMKKALAAGATLLSEARDYDYGYRQGQIRDPFGHHWLIEMVI